MTSIGIGVERLPDKYYSETKRVWHNEQLATLQAKVKAEGGGYVSLEKIKRYIRQKERENGITIAQHNEMIRSTMLKGGTNKYMTYGE